LRLALLHYISIKKQGLCPLIAAWVLNGLALFWQWKWYTGCSRWGRGNVVVGNTKKTIDHGQRTTSMHCICGCFLGKEEPTCSLPKCLREGHLLLSLSHAYRCGPHIKLGLQKNWWLSLHALCGFISHQNCTLLIVRDLACFYVKCMDNNSDI
jgi:hypothetical protein